MEFLDANGDGKITEDEANAELKPFFAQVDTNGDGGIDLQEAAIIAQYANDAPAEVEETIEKQEPASPPEPGEFTAESVMEFLDANGDGKITEDEANAELKPFFSQLDTNGDGGIDLMEAAVVAQYANNPSTEVEEPNGKQTAKSPPAPGEFTAENLMAFMDANGDGKITEDEAIAELQPFFC